MPATRTRTQRVNFQEAHRHDVPRKNSPPDSNRVNHQDPRTLNQNRERDLNIQDGSEYPQFGSGSLHGTFTFATPAVPQYPAANVNIFVGSTRTAGLHLPRTTTLEDNVPSPKRQKRDLAPRIASALTRREIMLLGRAWEIYRTLEEKREGSLWPNVANHFPQRDEALIRSHFCNLTEPSSIAFKVPKAGELFMPYLARAVIRGDTWRQISDAAENHSKSAEYRGVTYVDGNKVPYTETEDVLLGIGFERFRQEMVAKGSSATFKKFSSYGFFPHRIGTGISARLRLRMKPVWSNLSHLAPRRAEKGKPTCNYGAGNDSTMPGCPEDDIEEYHGSTNSEDDEVQKANSENPDAPSIAEKAEGKGEIKKEPEEPLRIGMQGAEGKFEMHSVAAQEVDGRRVVNREQMWAGGCRVRWREGRKLRYSLGNAEFFSH